MKIRDNRKNWNTDADLIINSAIVLVEPHLYGAQSLSMTLETGYLVMLDEDDIGKLEKYFTEKITKEVMKRMTGKKNG
jgi:hypothetical protein